MIYRLVQIVLMSFLALFSLSSCKRRVKTTTRFVGNTIAGGAYGVAAGTLGVVGQRTILRKIKKPEATPTAVAAAFVGSSAAGALTGGPLGAVMGGAGGVAAGRDLVKNDSRRNLK